MEKRPLLDQNHGKISIFGLFELLDFFALKGVFPFQNIFPKIKRWKKCPILDQSHGLTPLEKSQFSQFLNFLIFFSLERRFLVLEYRKTHFLAYIA